MGAPVVELEDGHVGDGAEEEEEEEDGCCWYVDRNCGSTPKEGNWCDVGGTGLRGGRVSGKSFLGSKALRTC